MIRATINKLIKQIVNKDYVSAKESLSEVLNQKIKSRINLKLSNVNYIKQPTVTNEE